MATAAFDDEDCAVCRALSAAEQEGSTPGYEELEKAFLEAAGTLPEGRAGVMSPSEFAVASEIDEIPPLKETT